MYSTQKKKNAPYSVLGTCTLHIRTVARRIDICLDISDIWSIYSLEGLFHIMFDCGKYYILHIRTVWQTQYITHTSCCTRTGFRFRLDATTCCQHQQQCASEKVLFYCLFNKLNTKFKSKSRAIYIFFTCELQKIPFANCFL